MENIKSDKHRQDVRVQPWSPTEGYNEPRDNYRKPSLVQGQGAQGNF